MGKASTFILLVLLSSFRTELATAEVVQDVLSISFGGTVTRWSFDGTESFAVPSGERGFGAMVRTEDDRYLAYRTSYSGGGTPALFEVDPETGQLTLLTVSTTAASHVVALTATDTPDLLGFDNSRGFLLIDSASLVFTPQDIELSNSAFAFFSGALATRSDGQIFAWISGTSPVDGGFSKLFEVDIAAGMAYEVGGFDNLQVSSGFNSMAFTDNGRLYGFTETNSFASLQPNSVYEIDLQSGIPSLISPLDPALTSDIRGAEFLPIPEPSALALIGIAGLSAFAWRRRR